MNGPTSRRSFLRTTGLGVAGAATLSGMPFGVRRALAADRLLVVQWGAKWIEVSKEILDLYNEEYDDQIAWELHSGGSAAVVAKIKATWPNTQYNVISVWDPVFRAMIAEDWLVPVTEEMVPNIKDIPKAYFQKNDAGELMNVPLSTAGAFWGFRNDMVDAPIERIEQLLEPRFEGKIAVPYPVNLTGLLIVSLAMMNGGDERNIEPGWDVLKELAEKGNIGRVCNNNSEFINAMSSGEVSAGFWNNGGWFATMQNFPVTMLNRVPDNKGFLYNEGFCILKGSPVEAASRFCDFFAGPEMNTKYNIPLGSGPTNVHSEANPQIADLYYAEDELERYGYFPDYTYLATQVDGWAKRWETEIVPLLRG